MKFLVIAFLYLTLFDCVYSTEITFKERNAVVWSQEQIVAGRISNLVNPSGTLYLNGNPTPFQFANDSTFSVQVKIGEGINKIWIETDSSGYIVISDTLLLTLGYNLRPEIYVYAQVNGNDITLHAQVIDNPDNSSLSFFWFPDAVNPTVVHLSSSIDSVANFSLPLDAPEGEYYFNLRTISSAGDTVLSATYITKDSSSVIPFNIKTDYAEWIDKAILYEITPYIFVENGQFKWITQKLSELKQLGVNTLWLQPIYGTHYKGQGYDITNYFSVRTDIGGEAQLTTLINSAKAMGFRIMFDFVANHSSIQHPYAKESSQYKTASHYYDFYQREEDDAPYSQHYKHYGGFINYFWNELPNLSYDNPEVQRWMIEAAKYWVEKYDIDGYRFDAVWGVNARNPEFTKQLRLALKRIKPDIFLMAEDKATWPMVFDERFDAAYDWAPGEDWVSQWTFQTDYSPPNNPTIFNNSNQTGRSYLLRKIITNSGSGYAPNARIVRFIENNDTQRFIKHHGIDRTKMAATLMFALHGIPMIYNGQETGDQVFPYDAFGIYQASVPIRNFDRHGLFDFYTQLVGIRKLLPALQENNYEEISISPSNYLFAFRRWEEKQNVICAINMGNADENAKITIPVAKLNLDSITTYYLTDVLNGEVFSGTPDILKTFNVKLPKYTTRIFLLADTAMTVVSVDEYKPEMPSSFTLEQNFPNPFNPVTQINYSIPQDGNVKLVIYDILGKEVSVLADGYKNSGSHSAKFNAEQIATGLYLYRLEHDGKSITKKMILLR